MKPTTILAAFAATALTSLTAHAGFLDGRSVTAVYGLDINPGGGVSGLEGSGITYARDRGTLFYVGDEGTGVIEISKTGQTIGTMKFDWTNTGSSNHDTEGLAYLGNGVLAIGEERLQDIYRVNYQAGTTATLHNSYVSISNTTVGNDGMEGITFDPRTNTFITVKQDVPEDILIGQPTFSSGGGDATSMHNLFNPALLHVDSFSDVASLAAVDAFAGTDKADNLLILSLASKKLLEVTRAGVIESMFDLSNVLTHNAIEGVTVDELGNIYLVAEQAQDGSGALNGESQMILLAAIPEPSTALFGMLTLGAIGLISRRRTLATA